jgi:high-affinity iron transporter
VTWADAVPNLLIGLREGLEAGLVVSILLAALRKTARGDETVSTAPVWLGVLGAVMVAGSFAAVLTFSTSVLSSAGREAVGGLLSVLAVGLVTAMIFWMRKTAATLSAHLRGEVARAVSIGPGALAVTAFLAVGREGLETTLFLWTAIKASGSTVAPLVGAGLGLVAAVIVCGLLYRQAVRLNLGVFFSRTALALVVIAAGVLAYGLGDLQDAGWLPGGQAFAFDLSAHLDPNSWWVSIITGLTELSPRMTVLQVVAWALYLAIVVPLFIRAGRSTAPAAAKAPAPVPTPAVAAAGAGGSRFVRWERMAGRRLWTAAGVLVVVPVVAATTAIVVLPSAAAASVQTVTVTASSCAKEWTSAHTGTQTIDVDNRTNKAGEIDLVGASGAVVAEIETIGPATTADLTATLSDGTYSFQCLMSGQKTTDSSVVRVSGEAVQGAPIAVVPPTVEELTPANDAYQAYAAGILEQLARHVAVIQADLKRGDLNAARTDWLPAQLDWEQVGASYDSFGDDGLAVDGLPAGLQLGVNDPGFTGLHRLEYGLWHGQGAAELTPVADTLAADVAKVQKDLTGDDLTGDPTNLPIRAHEILEDALRDHLSGVDALGSGAAYAETYADVQVTRVVLGELSAPITKRAPTLPATLGRQLDSLQSALEETRSGTAWIPASQVSTTARDDVDGAIGALLENLDQVPDLLEVPPSH